MDVAIIGSGISGLGISYLLNDKFNISLYESNDYIGGHSRTVVIDGIPIDIGFIVFNFKNYPNLTGLFDHLGVDIVKSDMSFGASVANNWLEYGSKNLTDMFAQKRNLLRPSFYRMLFDIIKFNASALKHVKQNPELSMKELIRDLGLGKWCQNYYLLAMAGAIWSSPTKQILEFPAQSLINFFDNHGLLSINDQPQWYTVNGGSKQYVEKLSAKFKDKIHLKSKVVAVERHKEGVVLLFEDGSQGEFDQVIFACHSDQALEIIKHPSKAEIDILGKIKYIENQVILHKDSSLMPKNKKAWASWVYLQEKHEHKQQISLTYWMNNLQPLNTNENYFVTLNPSRTPKDICHSQTFHHPQFDMNAIKAQKRIQEIQGQNNTWFCGAWQNYGFHEDGLTSAINLAQQLGVTSKWT